MPIDLYDILGVEPSADEERIKRAFRRAAYECHPDHNPDDPKAEAKFKRVAAAFDVLSDPKRRRRYDQYGLEGVDEHLDFDEPDGNQRRQGWDQRAGSADSTGGGRKQERTSDESELGDVFRDVFDGRSPFDTSHFHDFSDFRRDRDDRARDRDREPFTGDDRDPWNRHRQVELPFRVAVNGGDIVLNVAGEAVKIVVPSGVEEGDRLRVRGEGEPVGDGTGDSGDLILHVQVASSRLWTRRGLDLEMSLPITVPEAVAGAEIDVPTPEGPVTVEVPRGIDPGTRLRLEGRGVEREGEVGDLLVTVLVQLPDELDEETRAAATKLADAYSEPVRGDLWQRYDDESAGG